jgi:hypothetical protein
VAHERLRTAVRARAAGEAARREHAVLPLEPCRAPRDGRGHPGRADDRRDPRPRRAGVLELDHLWADGLEPEADFLTACTLEDRRIEAGWAPFWRYVELGRYGGQLEDLLRYFPKEQVLVLRYRDMVDHPTASLDAVCAFLGIRTGVVTEIPPSNVGRWADDSSRNRRLRTAIRLGAVAGAHAPPTMWRRVERRLLRNPQEGAGARPRIDPEARRALLGEYRDDVALLERLTGDSYRDWFSDGGTDRYRIVASGVGPVTGLNASGPSPTAPAVRSYQFSAALARPS